MRSILRYVITPFVLLVFLTILGLYLTGYGYVLRGARIVYGTGHTTAYIDDFKYFEVDTISAPQDGDEWPLHSRYNLMDPPETLLTTNENLGTVAFLVIHQDSILYERYEKGYGPESRTNSFSMAKSFTSALLGRAIMDGYIKSLKQPVADFYSQYRGTGLTVGDLSSMASGMDWEEHYSSPFSDTARAYYGDDLAEFILSVPITGTPGKEFRYLSGNTQLLGMVIQKAVDMPIAEYLEKTLWKEMGAQNDAIWQVDDEDSRLAKTYCCIGSNARDFARLGKLYLQNGNWNGEQLLPADFVKKSIQPRFRESDQYGYGFWLGEYQGKDFFMMRGILGQYVICLPEEDLIVVRLGHQRGQSTGRVFTNDVYTYIAAGLEMLPQELP